MTARSSSRTAFATMPATWRFSVPTSSRSPLYWGSATPSLESLQNARSGRYQHLHLTRRAGNATPPVFKLLDIRQQTLDAGLSAALISQIRSHLDQGTQVLLFLNRRGFSPALICHDCGTPVDCTRCDARMTPAPSAPSPALPSLRSSDTHSTFLRSVRQQPAATRRQRHREGRRPPAGTLS